jgi:hypothetical protein
MLDRECSTDPELRRRVEALLRAHDELKDFMNQLIAGPGGWAAWYHVVSNNRTPGNGD